MHPDVCPHAAKSVTLVPTDGAAEGFDSLVRIHVALGRTSRRADRAADWASPAARRTDRARVRNSRFDHRLLNKQFISKIYR